MDLGIDADELNKCVQCGLCLSSCPTFRVTGDETRSPRGRIALMRAVQNDGAPMTEQVVDAFDTCVQCRACETACPSGVPYGHLIEATRETLTSRQRGRKTLMQAALAPLAHPQVLSLGSRAIALAQRTGLVPSALPLPRLGLRQEPLQSAERPDVWLFTGCVMDAWQREVHADTIKVLAAYGVRAGVTESSAPCCGALHMHAGLADQAHHLADQVMTALADDDRPVLVNSAGCGAMLKDYGRLLSTPQAEALSARTFDICEWLAARADDAPGVDKLEERVAIQDPCHLRHVQRVHSATAEVLRRFVNDVVALDDDGMCCGAGGAYSALHPALASDIRKRKIASIERSGAAIVASANPGCSMHLAAGGVATEHPMTIVARALR